jgi:hypothetical protein
MAQAACAGMDREVFYSVYAVDRRIAQAACEVCPVRQQCLDFAIEHRDDQGIWGGATAADRERAGMAPPLRGDWVARLRGCGTQRGVDTHRDIGTELCGACRDVSRRRARATGGLGNVA